MRPGPAKRRSPGRRAHGPCRYSIAFSRMRRRCRRDSAWLCGPHQTSSESPGALIDELVFRAAAGAVAAADGEGAALQDFALAALHHVLVQHGSGQVAMDGRGSAEDGLAKEGSYRNLGRHCAIPRGRVIALAYSSRHCGRKR